MNAANIDALRQKQKKATKRTHQQSEQSRAREELMMT
jgi:hypothetical protein